MFGEGTIDFPPIMQALRDSGYRGGVHVELSRHSHMAVRGSPRRLCLSGPAAENLMIRTVIGTWIGIFGRLAASRQIFRQVRSSSNGLFFFLYIGLPRPRNEIIS